MLNPTSRLSKFLAKRVSESGSGQETPTGYGHEGAGWGSLTMGDS